MTGIKLIQLTIAVSVLMGCRSNPPPSSEPSTPSAAAARFADEGAGSPEVGAARLEVHQAGKVSLPNGQLAVSDAFIHDPLVVSDLPAGEYAIELLIAKSRSDERVAAARVQLRNESAATWRRVGFIAIDSGTAAFYDPRISSSITPSNVERFNDTVLKALEESTRPTYSTAAISWEGITFVAFSTGFGDGRYPVFLGSSAAGVPLVVLVDCEILPWPQ
jgi:hypothetical protein